MKLKTGTRNSSIIKRQEISRKSPIIVSHLNNKIIKNLESQQKKRFGSTTISPYLGELQRRRKIRSVVTRHQSKEKQIRKVIRQSSSKRFRIQQCAYNPFKNSIENLKTISHKSERQSNKSVRNFGNTAAIKYHNDLSAYTQKSLRIQNQNPSMASPFYNQLYHKLKAKSKRQNKFRRGKFIQSSLDRNLNTTPTVQNTAVLQLGFTTNNMAINSECTTISHQKAVKRNFRKNKFDIQSQAMTQTITQTNNFFESDKIKHNSVQIQKKQSNLSLIRQLNYQTENDIQMQQKNARLKMKRQVDRSLQKSTEQYFGDSNYRKKFKSKNEIQTYLSTVRNPSKIRNSQTSTLDASNTRNHIQQKLTDFKEKSLNYNFDIEQDIVNPSNIVVIQQSQSNTQNNQQSLDLGDQQFNRQRRQVQRAKFQNCDVVGISWSDQQLQFKKLNSHPV